ncbi:uncharacterized protein LOC117596304 [Pangasianodon hypophthalmus]|uniref:uncharacterized protein LOC117596304 n=1 Tax=Pangasianodon hypophthalmus TaxID=310915 RepID=UPI002307ABF6|nr:uncharacterized protein LOC117596304 [Pangasianodon hypophthalmus]
METSRVALIALVCVVFSSQKRISGAEVEMRVRRGGDVTLYSDCVWKSGLDVVWFKHCSYRDHPALIISAADLMRDAFPRYSSVQNKTNNTHNLLIKNVTESDMGLYYCAVIEKKLTSTKKFRYGNRSTQLSLLGLTLHFISSTAGVQPDQGRNDKIQIQRSDMDEGEEVCYASLDVKKLKKENSQRDQHSDFSTYSEVRMRAAEEE